VGIANDYTPIVDDLTAPTIAHAAFRIADEVRLLKARAKYLFDHQQDSVRLSYRVKASELLDKNVPVRAVGYDPVLGMVIVAKANISTLAFGVTREVISQGSSGLVTYSGILDNIDTSAWAIGTILYVGDKGTYTTTAPAAGYVQPIAYVIEQDSAKGSILVVMGYLNQDAAAIRVTPLSCITGYTVQEVIAGIGTRLINAERGISGLKVSLDLADEGIKTVRYSVVAIAGQTTITIPLSGFKTAEVYINGVHQDPFAGAYTILNSTFTFTKALSDRDSVYFVLGVGYEVEANSNVYYEIYTASAGQTQFKLTYTPIAEETLLFINGVKLAQNSYSINLDTIMLAKGLVAGDTVEVMRINRIQADTEYHDIITLSKRVIQENRLIPNGYNANSIGPLEFADTVVVTVSDDAIWTIT
jgi:hypothetical protein